MFDESNFLEAIAKLNQSLLRLFLRSSSVKITKTMVIEKNVTSLIHLNESQLKGERNMRLIYTLCSCVSHRRFLLQRAGAVPFPRGTSTT
jgi:hypothetical protein